MYGLRSDRILRYFRCIGCEDEGSQLCIGAETGCNALGVANCVLDGRLLVLSCIPSCACCQPTGSLGSLYRPINGSSCHSKMTMLTRGSPSSFDSSFMNFVRMKGSTDPPHDFRLYMPEHRCRFASSCFWLTVSKQSSMERISIQAGLRYQRQSLPDMPVPPA